MGDLPVREAQHPESRRDVLLVPLDRPGLLGRGAVVAQPVGLDDQVVVGEEEVGLVAEDPVFGERQREPRGERQRTEEDLQV